MLLCPEALFTDLQLELHQTDEKAMLQGFQSEARDGSSKAVGCLGQQLRREGLFFVFLPRKHDIPYILHGCMPDS